MADTRHDRFVREDYRRLSAFHIKTVREGLRWTEIARGANVFDFTSAIPFLEAARTEKIEIIWDLLHFGWPDSLDIYKPEWVEAFEEFAYRFALLLRNQCDAAPLIAPVNEISFFAWGGGDVGYLNPFQRGRGFELKCQLVRGAVRAVHAIRSVLPQMTIVAPDPVIHIAGDTKIPGDVEASRNHSLSMFEAWDMLTGRRFPELGGSAAAVDVIGINYYDRNQRWNAGPVLRPGDAEYRPFGNILREVYQRYRLPLFISETGTEDQHRPAWLAYVLGEVRQAIQAGIPVQGICLYPILNHPGWDDDRHCHNGLWDYANDVGERELYLPLAEEIRRHDFVNGPYVSVPPVLSTHGPTMTYSRATNRPENSRTEDLVCFSHLRWDFVFQRPQHLMSRFAAHRRVFFVEEPLRERTAQPHLRFQECSQSGVRVVTPILPEHMPDREVPDAVAVLVRELFLTKNIQEYIAWFYTPMAFDCIATIKPKAVIYDCMDELSLFRHAPPQLAENERKLFSVCDLVFTGGYSLFEAKKAQHDRVYAFPSSLDSMHFTKARELNDTAPDQMNIPKPRLGYAGVIDERIEIGLIDYLAANRPEWQIVMIGPIAKIDPAALPRRNNIHWLGIKNYQDLPLYFAGWDAAMMPFAMNDSTRYISPTKTPEYLAAGLPVISTPIRDVVRQYGDAGVVGIGASYEEFLAHADKAMKKDSADDSRAATQARADALISALSWDTTFQAMNALISEVLSPRSAYRAEATGAEEGMSVAAAVADATNSRLVVPESFAQSVRD